MSHRDAATDDAGIRTTRRRCRWLSARIIVAAALLVAGVAFVRQSAGVRGQSPEPAPFGFGRPAPPMLIAAWNIDVRPDGAGLPAGSGTVAQGRMVYGAKCASCHGDTGREGGEGPILVDTRPFRPGITPTVGNYWPYAATVWDYINRTMPFDEPGSLVADEVYALVAFLLNENGIIAEDAVMDAQTLPRVVMPNVNGFLSPDPRPDVP